MAPNETEPRRLRSHCYRTQQMKRLLSSHVFVLGLTLATSARAQLYAYDDGMTENALSPVGANDVIFLSAFDVAGGGMDILSELQVGVGTALAPAGGLDGNPLTLAVWNDPTNDHDPTDAVLVYQSPLLMVASSNTDLRVSYPIPGGIAVSDGFFVGALTNVGPSEFPVGLDLDGPFSTTSNLFWVGGDAGAADLTNLGGNSVPVYPISGALLIGAVGGSSSGLGTTYCSPGIANSTGFAATISASGSNSFTTNQLTLTAGQLPAGQFGFFLCSLGQGFIPAPGGSQGNLCLGANIGRYNGPGQILNSLTAGGFSLQLDLTQTPTPVGPVAVAPGETWNFQCWYRDLNPAATSNFTDAVEVTFL